MMMMMMIMMMMIIMTTLFKTNTSVRPFWKSREDLQAFTKQTPISKTLRNTSYPLVFLLGLALQTACYQFHPLPTQARIVSLQHSCFISFSHTRSQSKVATRVGACTLNTRSAAYDANKKRRSWCLHLQQKVRCLWHIQKKRCVNSDGRKSFWAWPCCLLFQQEPETSITASSMSNMSASSAVIDSKHFPTLFPIASLDMLLLRLAGQAYTMLPIVFQLEAGN